MPRPLTLAILIAVLALWVAVPGMVTHAVDPDHPGAPTSGRVPPGSSAAAPGSSAAAPGGYLSNLYLWFIGFVGIAALFMIVAGGITYMFSGTNLTKVEQGRQWITNAIWGIVIAAFAVLLLRTINPDLVRGFNFDQIINRAVTRPTAPTTPVPNF